MNSFRRKRDLTRPEGETVDGAHASADFEELLSTLEQKVSLAHVSLLAGRFILGAAHLIG